MHANAFRLIGENTDERSLDPGQPNIAFEEIYRFDCQQILWRDVSSERKREALRFSFISTKSFASNRVVTASKGSDKLKIPALCVRDG